MTSKKANWLFLTIILVHIGVVAILYFAGDKITINIITNFILSEGILMVPTLAFLLAFGRKAKAGRKEAAAFHKVKISTLLMIILCTFLVNPMVIVLNALSMLFAENAMTSLQGYILEMPFPVMLFMIGILAPFCEEFVFRGVIYRSYSRKEENKNNVCYGNERSRGIRAILLSALLFGLMHMNFNQMIYAFAMGIFLALLVEAAGSLWASVFCHMFFNSAEVVLMYVSRNILESVYGQTVNEAAVELTTQDLLAAVSVYLVIAAVATPIAVCVIVWIAKNEGRQEAMAELFAGLRVRGQRQSVPQQQSDSGMQTIPQTPEAGASGYLMSVPLIVAIVLCFGYMSLEFFL